MATELREIDIRNYMPPVVRNTAEFQQIATAENPEFNNFQACIYQVLQDSFVQDATEYGVKRWENILNISPENGDTLETRKERILTYLNIKLPYTWRVLKQMLISLLGEENVEMKLNNETATLTVAVALDTTEAQIEAVEQLLGRVLPQNLVTEMYWADGLPISYTHVEYLETNNVDNAQFIATGIIPTSDTSCKMRMMSLETSLKHVMFAWATIPAKFAMLWGSGSGLYQLLYLNGQTTSWRDSSPAAKQYEWRTFENRKNELWINNVLRKTLNPEDFACDTQLYLFIGNSNVPGGKGLNRCSGFECWNDDGALANYIPALDPTGAPCFYDTVSKKPFYNSGAGDFLYPGSESATQTTDMEDTFYAKLTPNGIRRLYHVPTGCTMSKDEYAAANGFKELVEPPMPLEGYWIPEWRETETQLICDWVETEPPEEEIITEEVTENE